MSGIAQFLGTQFTDGGEVFSFTRRPYFYPKKHFMEINSIKGLVHPKVIVGMKGLGQLIKFNYLVGNRTRELPACSSVPQTATLPCAFKTSDIIIKILSPSHSPHQSLNRKTFRSYVICSIILSNGYPQFRNFRLVKTASVV
jgi:hypothetical protein